MSLGFIGFGNMASAMWKGWLRSGEPPMSASFSVRSPERSSAIVAEFGLTPRPLADLIHSSEVIVLAIKPAQLKDSVAALPASAWAGKHVISVLAGTKIATLTNVLGPSVAITRAMPNTPVALGKGVTGLAFSALVSGDQRSWVNGFFGAMGIVVEIPEAQFDWLTAVTGCGPAFFYKLAEAVMASATGLHLPATTLQHLVASTMAGSAAMLMDGRSAADLVTAVASKGGATEAGLKVFNSENMAEKMAAVIHAAAQRAEEMSRGG